MNGPRTLWLLWPVILAGEAIFLLPFVLPRLFRPTMLEAWGISNLDFGLAFSCYGLFALFAYALGGPLADRFQPRWLMCIALAATACGGLVLLGTPNRTLLCCTYACFGVTTILLFWPAMLKVTHELGGNQRQATAFGLLDAGRGLFAAVISTVLVLLFSLLLPDQKQTSPEELAKALRIIVIMTIVLVATAAVLLPLTLVTRGGIQPTNLPPTLTNRSVALLLRRPALWLHGLVVLCAYCGYKSIDNYGIFAVDVFGWTDIEAAQLTALTFWARPFAAIAAGLVSDRFNHFKSMAALFILTVIGNLSLMFLLPQSMPWLGLTMVAVTTAAAMYGLRGIYFAVFDDLQIPPGLIGTAAGIISLIGFLPDVFFGTLTGFLIDHYPGRQGHQFVFGLICFVSLIGFFACLWNDKHLSRRVNAQSESP
ncbi:MAG: MFS transporter [Rhodopirellula sp.]|nr:MFS transporter [Rhodopirellula sp.]